MNNDLKACPFCGAIPHLDRHEIFCDCGSSIHIDKFWYMTDEYGRFPTYEKAREMAIDAWNRRADNGE